MLIKKNLETSLDLTDPNEIYRVDLDDLIKKKLMVRYVGRCYQSCYVTEVTKIIRRSSIRLVDNRIDGGATVDVLFEIQGIILVKGELLHGCKIAEIQQQTITAENKYAAIKLQKGQSGSIFGILKVGQIIPIVVSKVRYSPNAETMSVIGTPFYPSVSKDIYCEITDELTIEQSEQIASIMEQITAEEAKHKTLAGEKSYEFFRDLMYNWKTTQKFEVSPLFTSGKFKPIELSMEKFMTVEKGIVVKPAVDSLGNKRFFHSPDPAAVKKIVAPDANSTVIQAGMFIFVSDLLNRYLLYLQGLRGFVETYDLNLMKSMVTYWSVCQKMRQ